MDLFWGRPVMCVTSSKETAEARAEVGQATYHFVDGLVTYSRFVPVWMAFL